MKNIKINRCRNYLQRLCIIIFNIVNKERNRYIAVFLDFWVKNKTDYSIKIVSLIWRSWRDLPLWGQLQPTIHTSYAKAHLCSLGCCHFCGLPLSATGSGRPRSPRAASGTRVQIHAKWCTNKHPLKDAFFWIITYILIEF